MMIRVGLLLLALLLPGCAGTYYDEEVYYQPRRYYAHNHYRHYDYDERRYYRRDRYREASYFQTAEHGVTDEYGQGWSRCRVHGRPAWCRVD